MIFLSKKSVEHRFAVQMQWGFGFTESCTFRVDCVGKMGDFNGADFQKQGFATGWTKKLLTGS